MPDSKSKFVSDLAQIGDALVGTGADLVSLNEARNRGNTLATENQILQDRSTLTPFQFGQKYGPRVQDLVDRVDQGNVALGQYMKGATRDGKLVSDTVIDVATGLNQSLGGIGVLGAGLVNPSLGVEASQLLDDFTGYTRRNMSRYVQRNEQIEAVRAQLDEIDNAKLYEQDAEKDGSFIAGLKYVGRDVLSSASRVAKNPALLKSTVAQGTGSLLASGPLGKALGAAGASTGTAIPAAIGLMEGGGVYSSTIQDIMGRSHEELLQTSPEYRADIEAGISPESAQLRMAHKAGITAASVQGPLSALIGKAAGVADFEAAPLASRAISKAAGNLVREPLEEGVQSLTGQVAQNLGVSLEANPDQSLIEGAGSAAALGAVGGLGSAAVVQAPGVALRSAAKAIGAGTRKIIQSGERILAANEAASPVSPENLAPAVTTAAENAPVVAEGVRALGAELKAKPEEVEALVNQVQQASQTTPEDLADLSPRLAQVVDTLTQQEGRALNKFEMLQQMADLAGNEQIPEDARVEAGLFLLKNINKNKKLFQEDLPAFLNKIPDDRPERVQLDDYGSILNSIEQTPSVQKALKWAEEQMAMSDQEVTQDNLQTPEGQQIVKNTVNAAVQAPQSVNLEVAEQILRHADEGKIKLTPEQYRIIQGAGALLRAERVYEAMNRVAEPGQVEQASDDGVRFVAKQIETEGGSRGHQLSLRQHVGSINQAVAEGNTNEVKKRIQLLGLFGRSMRNKLEAMNTAIQNGDRKRVPYQALGRNGKWLPADNHFSVFFNPGTSESERTARQIHAETVATVQLANDFAKQYPAFGIKQVEIPTLNLKDNGGSSTPVAAPTETQATTTRSDVEQAQQTELPPPPSQPTRTAEVKPQADEAETTTDTGQAENEEPLVSRITPEQAKRLSDGGLNERIERLMDLREQKQMTNEDRATFDVLDAEMTRREDEAIAAEEAAEDPQQETQPEEAAATQSDVKPPKEKTTLKSFEGLAEALGEQPQTETPSDFADTPVKELEVAPRKVEEAFPNLVRVNDRNWFHKAFRFTKEVSSRLFDFQHPLFDLRKMLKTTKYRTFPGEELSYALTPDQERAFDQLLGMGTEILQIINNRAGEAFTVRKDGKPSLKDLLDKGTEITRWRDARLFNIMEKINGANNFNPQLIESAVLAGLDWALTQSNRQEEELERNELAALLGISEKAVTKAHAAFFETGMSLDIAVRSLTDHIQKFWGVRPNNSIRDAYTVGIPEAVAKEVLFGLASVDLVDYVPEAKVLGSEKTFQRVLTHKRPTPIKELVASLNGVTKLLGDLALVDRQDVNYSIGKPTFEASETQLRNPLVKLTRQHKKAIRNAESTPYVPNLVMFDFMSALGKGKQAEERFVTLLSGHPYKDGDLNKKHTDLGLNKNDWDSIKGKQLTRLMSFQGVSNQMAAVKAHADAEGISVRDVPSFFKHNIQRLGRPQMAGGVQPQSDKYARHVFTATRTTLDLSKPGSPDFLKWLLTVGQGIGVKTEIDTRGLVADKTIKRTMDKLGDLYPLVQEMKAWIQTGGIVPDSTFELLTKAKLSEHGIDAVLSVAQYELAREQGADLTKFEVHNPLEADGKTNGPINSLMLMTSGPITADWLKAIGKGGVYFGRLGKTLNSHQSVDSLDLYREGSNGAQSRMQAFGDRLLAEGHKKAHEQFLVFRRFLKALNVDVDIDKDGKLVIQRGLLKNPMTTTVYGAGATGIAGKITADLVGAIYEALSISIKEGKHPGELLYPDDPQAFTADLKKLIYFRPGKSEKTDAWYVTSSKAPEIKSWDPAEFTLDPEHFASLQENVETFLVSHMMGAIEETINHHVSVVTSTIQTATQLQSIFAKGIYIQQFAKKMAELTENPDETDYRTGDGLSKDEQDKLREYVLRFSPIIDTGTQRYLLSSGETTELFDKTKVMLNGQPKEISSPKGYSRSVTGGMPTPSHFYGQVVAGVKAIPTMVVGSGDGQMMMNFLSENPGLARRVLHVFDGLYMPADAVEAFSNRINESVYKTWTSNGNPVRAVLDSFKATLAADPVKELFPAGLELSKEHKQALLEISQAFYNKRRLAKNELLTVGEIQPFLEETLEKLEELADDLDVRRQLYTEFDLSVDQMASGETPYVHEGIIKLAPDASLNDIEKAMQERYEELHEALRRTKAEAKPAEGDGQDVYIDPKILTAVQEERQAFRDALAKATAGEFGEAQWLTANGRHFQELRRLLVDTGTPVQKEMARAAIDLLTGSDYRIVFGSPSQLDAWEQQNNADRFIPDSNTSFGKIDPISKIILVSSSTPETIVHELIHAATIDKVQAYYENPSALSKEDRDAVARIENLMVEWQAINLRDRDPDSLANARIMAENAINARLGKGQKAEALNEFMAYVLSNQDLAKQAQRTKVKNPLARIIGDVLAALKTLLWGAENKGPKVGDNILSNLRFNTRVLMATPTPVELLKQDSSAVMYHQSLNFGFSDRLTGLREAFNNKIVAWMRDPDPLVRADRDSKAQHAVREARDLAAIFSHAFPALGNMQAYSTFTAIQAALSTEAELNTNALSRVEDLYAHVIETLNADDFRENNDPNDQNDITQAQDKFNTLQGVFGTTTDKFGRSSLMSSFLALALVDDQFRNILSQMEKPKAEKRSESTFDALVENTAMAGLDRLSLMLSGEKNTDVNVRDALDTLTFYMIENVGDQRSYIAQRAEGFLEKIERKTADFIQDKSLSVANKMQQVKANTSSKAVKAAASLPQLAAIIVNEEKMEEAQLGLVHKLNKLKGWESLRAVVNDVVGRTRENASVFDMISKTRSDVQQTRQQFRDRLPEKLGEKFTRIVTQDEWTSMFKALGKTDLAALFDQHGVQGALEMVTDNRKLSREVRRLEAAVQAAGANFAAARINKAKQLAHFMLTGEHGPSLLRNARAVAYLMGEPNRRGITATPQLIEQIDQLVTLYSVQSLNSDTKQSVQSLISDQKDGVEFVFSYLIGQRVDELAKVGNGPAWSNHYKGYIPSEQQDEGHLIIASDSEHAKLVGRGYIRIDAYKGSSADRGLGRRSYYYTPVSGRAPFSQGVMQTVHQTASGVDPQTGFTVGEVMAGRIEDPQVIRIIQRQLVNQRITKENLLPVFDDNGDVVAYERAADPAQLAKLNQSTNLAKMIGVWRGRQVEELLAREVNEQLVDNLKAIWDDGKREGRQSEFVRINVADPRRNSDPIHRDAARLVPYQTRNYIDQVFGGDLWVRRDMLNDTLGARQASVGDLFTGESRWHPTVTKNFEKIAMGIFDVFGHGNKAYTGMIQSERILQEVVTNAKVLIVVKSIVVPTANIMANMFQLLNRGVPLSHIVRGMTRKTAEISAYIKRRAKEIDLEADLRAARGKNDLVKIRRLENEIQSLQDSYRRMTIWPLIEAGEFSAISSGQVTAEDLAIADGRWSTFVERMVNKLPNGVRAPVRYGLITRDTALFQGLARAVQYGDFVAKAVLYDDLTRRKNASPKDALATVNEAFINYNRLAGRGRQYLESVGLLWFYSFKLRAMKEAAWMLRHNPLRSLLMTAVPNFPIVGNIGTPVEDNFLAVLNDGRLDNSIGPGMGLNSFGLNPWINVAR